MDALDELLIGLEQLEAAVRNKDQVTAVAASGRVRAAEPQAERAAREAGIPACAR